MARLLMRSCFALATLAALAACTAAPADSSAQVARTDDVAAPSATIAASRRTAITDAVARVAPSVVTVQTEVVQRVQADPFDVFFGGRSGTQTSAGLGTGFIIRPDGVIVTNAHVVAGATSISVMLRDGTTYPARMIGTDETNDLAVIQVKTKVSGLPVAPLGDSDNLLVGEWAIAIGNPYGFMLGNSEPSVTAGVISGVGRNLVARGEGPSAYFDMIQTDASINPGNSGGPLVSAGGDVVGVNSSIYSTSGGSVGLGFAIPINRARRVAEDLLTHGRVRRPWIGVQLEQPRTQNTRDLIARGALVAAVTPGSPAQRAGIRPGDLILRVRSRMVRNRFDWDAALLDLRVEDQVPLVVRRGGAEVPVTVAIADLPEVTAPKVQVLRELELVSLTPAIRAERGIQSLRGALIYRASDRILGELLVQPGDVIVQINRTPIGSAEDASRALDYYSGRGPIRLFFERQGQISSTDFVIR
jgi:serine protease Do